MKTSIATGSISGGLREMLAAYGDGFFFEIIERRGDYRGYGAANAQFRISAQKRHMPPPGYS